MKSSDLDAVKKALWDAADELRANSSLTPADYRGPVLGLIFLAYAEHRFDTVGREVEAGITVPSTIGPADYTARGVLYVADTARLSYLVSLPDGTDVGRAVDGAMRRIERDNPSLRDVLPKDYARLDRSLLLALLRLFEPLPRKLSGDAFGLIYEDFLSNFALAEGRLGGEFYTPHSIVRLIVEVIEPYYGRIFDPACGSAGMFVQCAKFVERHTGSAVDHLSLYGQEQKAGTVPLAKMNLALHGLSGDIRLANTYYEDPHGSVGRFDFVMANPPFNVNKVDKTRLAGDPRLPFGVPRPDNANYLWIQQFYSALAPGGRAGFVMPNGAADAGHSERDIRRRLVEERAVDVMVAVGGKFFYTVTLPVTLWFLDRGKAQTPRRDTVLFVDARHVFEPVNRRHRTFAPEQVELLANVVRLYRGEPVETVDGSEPLVKEHFPDGRYADVPGLCAVATLEQIEAQDWSLSPVSYVAPAAADHTGDPSLAELYDELTRLGAEAEVLRAEADAVLARLLADE